jgi:hypothetical protein
MKRLSYDALVVTTVCQTIVPAALALGSPRTSLWEPSVHQECPTRSTRSAPSRAMTSSITATAHRGQHSRLPTSPLRSSWRTLLHQLLERTQELRPAAACLAGLKILCSRPQPVRTTRAHVSQLMKHAQMGDEECWRPRTNELEGCHDEGKPNSAPPVRPAAALHLRRWSSAPNVKYVDLATRLQLERVER